MSRATRTNNEEHAISLFCKYLCDCGVVFEPDSEVTDRPDLVIKVGNRRIGCELTIVTPQEMMRWYGTHKALEKDRVYKVTVPVEPDLWMQKIVESKSVKADSYLGAAALDEIWLVIHNEALGLPAIVNDAYTISMLEYVATTIGHKFSAIYYVYDESHTYALFREGMTSRPKPPVDLSKGFPVVVLLSMGAIVTQQGLIADMAQQPIEEITLRPLTPGLQLFGDVRFE
jgi:hypothetical protein